MIGPETRIEVLTEGVLTRRLQNDPELPGVAAVLFDEVHERNLTTDLGLALTLDVASALRPDLRIVAMSATADTASFARLLATDDGGPAPIVVSEGRTHPIDLRWLPRQRNDRIEQAVASAVERALRDDDGDVLVFLPGIGEITRVRERLVASLPPTSTFVRSPARCRSRTRTSRWHRRRPVGAGSCSPPTSPRRRSPSRASASSSTAASPGRRGSTPAPG